MAPAVTGPITLKVPANDWVRTFREFLPLDQPVPDMSIPGKKSPAGTYWESAKAPGAPAVTLAAAQSGGRNVGKLMEQVDPDGGAYFELEANLDLTKQFLEDTAAGQGKELSEVLRTLPGVDSPTPIPAVYGMVTVMRTLNVLEKARRTGDPSVPVPGTPFGVGPIPGPIVEQWKKQGVFVGSGNGAAVELRRIGEGRYSGKWYTPNRAALPPLAG
jgi:hypothetical protein